MSKTLKTKHLFSLVRLVKELNLREIIKNTTSKIDKNQVQKDIGIDLLLDVMGECSDKNSEKKVYNFLAEILEREAEEVENMDLIELSNELRDIADFNKWKDFFSQASKLTKLKP